MWETKRLLVVVKTYPNPSRKHQETVCTAAVDEHGSWHRLYPIRFRDLSEPQQYSKFDWIEARVRRAARDGRPESYNVDEDSIKRVGAIPSSQWDERLRLLRPGLVESVEDLQRQNAASGRSLALLKPNISGFDISDDPDPTWSAEQLEFLAQAQLPLPGTPARPAKRQLQKIPYQFRYVFDDRSPECPGHRMQIFDWEIYELARKYTRDPDELREKVSLKYEGEFLSSRDVHLVLGTLAAHPDTFTIVGVVAPPRRLQMSFDFG